MNGILMLSFVIVTKTMYLGHYHVAGFVLVGLVVLPVHRSSVSPTDSYSSESVESEISLSSSLQLPLPHQLIPLDCTDDR